MIHNPSLRQEPRYEPASVIPLKQDSSILEWLKENNRLIPRERDNTAVVDSLQEDLEISELMEGDDHYEDNEIEAEPSES